MFPSRACQIPPDANAETERGRDDYIKDTLLSDPRVQLSADLTGRTSSTFDDLCPKALAILFFCVLTPQYQFLSFAHSYHCLPSCSLKSLIRLKASIQIASFFLPWLLSRSLFSFKATNGDVVVFYSQELQIKRETQCKRIF